MLENSSIGASVKLAWENRVSSEPSGLSEIRDSNRIQRLMVAGVRRVVFERSGKQISPSQAKALAQLGDLLTVVAEINRQSQIPRKSTTPIEGAIAVALYPDDLKERRVFLHEVGEERNRSEREQRRKEAEKQHIERIIEEIRIVLPQYKNFLKRVMRAREHERGRLAIGTIGDDSAYELGLTQLDALYLRVLKEAKTLVEHEAAGSMK